MSMPETTMSSTPFRTLVLIATLATACMAAAQAREQFQAHNAAAPGPTRVAQQSGAPNGPDSTARGRGAADLDSQQQQELLNRQKRRDVLREALRVQADEAPAATRQLSAQEKIELRQQLRQQQEWLNK